MYLGRIDGVEAAARRCNVRAYVRGCVGMSGGG